MDAVSAPTASASPDGYEETPEETQMYEDLYNWVANVSGYVSGCHIKHMGKAFSKVTTSAVQLQTFRMWVAVTMRIQNAAPLSGMHCIAVC